MISLDVENARLVFDADLAAARDHGLELSSPLLGLARAVIGRVQTR